MEFKFSIPVSECDSVDYEYEIEDEKVLGFVAGIVAEDCDCDIESAKKIIFEHEAYFTDFYEDEIVDEFQDEAEAQYCEDVEYQKELDYDKHCWL